MVLPTYSLNVPEKNLIEFLVAIAPSTTVAVITRTWPQRKAAPLHGGVPICSCRLK
jgi:hypothetical protein